MTVERWDGVEWPTAAKAAVSLTYDDALASQRQNAAAQLRRYRLPGTFFLTGNSGDLAAHRTQWSALLSEGHELSSHTMHHPCDCSHDWVPKGYATQDYDLERMATELDATLELLEGLGAPRPYTFAYPCGESRVGVESQSYTHLVDQRFTAARGVEPRLAKPAAESLSMVPAYDGATDAATLVALLNEALTTGGWLVFLFHGVGGDHMPVALDAHEALLAELDRRRSEVWTGTFGAVATHVRGQRTHA
jgi:peptidoglycan/xylan/chitin deacetylase (PgdA/CDA1 family)